MKKIICTILLVVFKVFICEGVSIKKVKIPLDNYHGIPYSVERTSYFIDGFDVDDNDYFYFLGGNKPVLTCFKNDTLIKRKAIKEFYSNKIYVFKDHIYVFDTKYNRSNLYVLNCKNIEIEITKKIIYKDLNNITFVDSTLILESIDLNLNKSYSLFSLNGRFKQMVNNAYNLPIKLYSNLEINNLIYLGQISYNYLFFKNDFKEHKFVFELINNLGNIVNKKSLDNNISGIPFNESSNEHIKLRNQHIYILGRNNQDALISVISVKDLFNSIDTH